MTIEIQSELTEDKTGKCFVITMADTSYSFTISLIPLPGETPIDSMKRVVEEVNKQMESFIGQVTNIAESAK